MAVFVRGVDLEHFIPQMHHLLRKTPLIMCLLWENKLKALQTAQAVLFYPMDSFLFIHPSLSFCRFISSTRLPCVYPIFWSHFSHSPCRCLSSSITPWLSLCFHVCFLRDREQEDGLRRWAWYWLSFVLLICFISGCWKEGWANADNAYTIKGGLPR